jgi:hypothetical protein
MAAILAPGEAVWLPEGEAPHDQANMGIRGIPESHRRSRIGFHLLARDEWSNS